MLFGKIDFINLAPFHVYMKRHIRSSRFKQSIEYKKSYPSVLNRKLKSRQIDAAFISSIASKNAHFRCIDAGIVARGEIRSVLVKRGSYKADFQSDTSNALAKVLGVEGEVIIGDKALKRFLQDPTGYEDLALLWLDRYGRPFVFARLCTVRHYAYYKRLVEKFLATRIKIPQYMLAQYAKKTGIASSDILDYLKLVSYNIDTKAKMSLKQFLKESAR